MSRTNPLKYPVVKIIKSRMKADDSFTEDQVKGFNRRVKDHTLMMLMIEYCQELYDSKNKPAEISPEFVAGLQAHLHHDINVLKLKIEKLEKENKELKRQPLFNKTEVVKQEQVDPIIDKWFMNQCEFADNVIDVDGSTEFAPSELQHLFDQFKDWYEDLELDIKQPDKKTFKTSLLAIQEKTPYGLSIGKNKSDIKVNGCKSRPLFNFKVRDDDPDFIY